MWIFMQPLWSNVFWSLLSHYFTNTFKGIQRCYLSITKIQKNAVIFYTFRRNVQCDVQESPNLLYICTEELQELYLNFCLVHCHCVYPPNNSFMLSVLVMFCWAGTGTWNVWPVVILEGYPLQSFLSSAAICTAPGSLGIDMAGTLFLVVLVATLPCAWSCWSSETRWFPVLCPVSLMAKTKHSFRWQNEVPTII